MTVLKRAAFQYFNTNPKIDYILLFVFVCGFNWTHTEKRRKNEKTFKPFAISHSGSWLFTVICNPSIRTTSQIYYVNYIDYIDYIDYVDYVICFRIV